jgi:hypothetical protein
MFSWLFKSLPADTLMCENKEMPLKKVRIAVEPGICGFSCIIEGWQKGKQAAGLRILDSECEMIQKLSNRFEEMTLKDFFVPVTKNPIFLAAEQAGCHLACPVPVAMVKVMEISLGLAVPRDVFIRFLDDRR